jgi:hypothetical protein
MASSELAMPQCGNFPNYQGRMWKRFHPQAVQDFADVVAHRSSRARNVRKTSHVVGGERVNKHSYAGH